MTEENISPEFRLKKLEETRNYFIEEINLNDLLSKKCKNVCRPLNYTKHLLNLAFAVTGCFSISAFASLVVVLKGIKSFALGVKIYPITAELKSLNQ